MPDSKTRNTFQASNPNGDPLLNGALPINTGWRGSMQLIENFMCGEVLSGKLGDNNWYTFYNYIESNAGLAGETMRVENVSNGNVVIAGTGGSGSSVGIALKKAPIDTGVRGGIFLGSLYFDCVFGFRYIPATTLTTELSMLIGLTDNPGMSSFNNFLGISVGASGFWNSIVMSGGVSTVGTSAFPRTTSYSRLRIRRLSATDIGMSLNESTEQVVSTNVPTTSLIPVFFLKSNNTTIYQMSITHFNCMIGNGPNFMTGR